MFDAEQEEDSGIELKSPDPKMGLASISHIKNALDRVFGKGEWANLEIETISLTLGIYLDELTRDKISVLQIVETQPELFFDDASFTLYATDVINNIEADFEFVPTPTTLELAFAISEIRKILVENGVYIAVENSGLVTTAAYILRNEGYSEPIYPFDFIPADKLEAGQTSEDTENKKKAIKRYIKEMSGS
jgi:hypothetical protein